jgi:hypothetical protein
MPSGHQDSTSNQWICSPCTCMEVSEMLTTVGEAVTRTSRSTSRQIDTE